MVASCSVPGAVVSTLRAPAVEVAAGGLAGAEPAGGFDDDVDPEHRPRDPGGVGFLGDVDLAVADCRGSAPD